MKHPKKRAQALTAKQIHRVLNTCDLMQSPELKKVALILSHAAMRVTEVALLETRSVITPAGVIRDEIYLPGAICKNLKSRTIWLSNSLSKSIVQEWIEYRLKRKWGLGDPAVYRGLNPNSRFLYNNRGRPYSIQPKPRKLDDGTIKTYWACDALEAMIRNIYKRCGLRKASSHSGRRSFVSNAVLRGVDLEILAVALGHSETDTTLLYCDASPTRLAEMCSMAL